jgi:PIN domain nuclease of toxin-antitoxin system
MHLIRRSKRCSPRGQLNLLVDTHVVIWTLEDSERLTPSIRNVLRNPRNQVFVSSISIYEILIKVQKGKLQIVDGFQEFIGRQDMQPLPFTWQHAEHANALAPLHFDPFDRALLGQAKAEDLTFVSFDRLIIKYAGEVRILNA